MERNSIVEKELRVGVIGLGIGKFHLKGWLGLASQGVKLAAVADLDATKMQVVSEAFSEAGLPTPAVEGFFYPDYRPMLAEAKLDAVSIAVPNFLHEAVAIAAFDAGCHVLLEKPLAHDLESGKRIVQAWKKSGKLGMAQLNNNYTPLYAMVKELVDKGRLGRLQTVKSWWTRRNGIPFWGMWFTNKERSGGGPGIDLMPHLLGWALGVMDWPDVKWVTANTSSQTEPESPGYGPYGGGMRNPNGICDVESRLSMRALLANNVALDVDVAWAMHTDLERMGFELVGNKGTIKVERVWPINDGDDAKAIDTMTLYATKTIAGFPVTLNTTVNPDVDPTARDPFMGRTKTQPVLLQCIREGGTPATDITRLLRIQEIIDAAYRSAAKSGDPVQAGQ